MRPAVSPPPPPPPGQLRAQWQTPLPTSGASLPKSGWGIGSKAAMSASEKTFQGDPNAGWETPPKQQNQHTALLPFALPSPHGILVNQVGVGWGRLGVRWFFGDAGCKKRRNPPYIPPSYQHCVVAHHIQAQGRGCSVAEDWHKESRGLLGNGNCRGSWHLLFSYSRKSVTASKP